MTVNKILNALKSTITASTTLVATALASNAAEISVISYGADSPRASYARMVQIYGTIEEGDAERFEELVKQSNAEGYVIDRVLLWSPGGMVDEAIRIGLLIRRGLMVTNGPRLLPYPGNEALWLQSHGFTAASQLVEYINREPWPLAPPSVCQTVASTGLVVSINSSDDENCICASACSLILFGGISASGVVGLHRSYIPNGTSLSFRDMEQRLGSSDASVNAYLDEMGVPQTIRDLLADTQSTNLSYAIYSRTQSVFGEYILARCGRRPVFDPLIDVFLDEVLAVPDSEREHWERNNLISFIANEMGITETAVVKRVRAADEQRVAHAACSSNAWREAQMEAQRVAAR
jgi:hypothetical protein